MLQSHSVIKKPKKWSYWPDTKSMPKPLLPPTAYQLNIRMFLYKSNVAEAFPIAHPRANEVVAEEDHLTEME